MKTDPLNPPPLRYADCWERCPDPFHKDAFGGIDLNKVDVIIIGDAQLSEGVRREGWAAIDFCGNVIGWYPDGEEFGGEALEYKVRNGPYGKEWYL